MKLPKEKFEALARDKAKRRLENLLTLFQKVEEDAADAERLCKIQRAAYINKEKLRVMAERRRVAGAEGLAVEASRKSTRRKSHPFIVDKKAEEARVDAERRNAASVEFVVAEVARLSTCLMTNPLTAEQRLKKPWQMQSIFDNLGSLLRKKPKMLELRPKDGILKVHKLQLLDYFISVIVTRLDLRRLPILLLRMIRFQTRY